MYYVNSVYTVGLFCLTPLLIKFALFNLHVHTRDLNEVRSRENATKAAAGRDSEYSKPSLRKY